MIVSSRFAEKYGNEEGVLGTFLIDDSLSADEALVLLNHAAGNDEIFVSGLSGTAAQALMGAMVPITEEELQGIGSYLEEGTADMEALLSGNQVLVAENDIVEEIYGWRFQVGDTVTLHYYDGSGMREKEVEIAGMLNDAFNRDHNGIEGWFVMPEQAVLRWISYDSINSSLLISTDPVKETEVGESLEQIVGDRSELTMETLAERRIAYEQSADQIFGAISGLAIFIMMFSILSMMNTLITNIVTRKQELAMLESIGMSKGQIRKMLLGRACFLWV